MVPFKPMSARPQVCVNFRRRRANSRFVQIYYFIETGLGPFKNKKERIETSSVIKFFICFAVFE